MPGPSLLHRAKYRLLHLHHEGSTFAWHTADPFTSLACLPAIALSLSLPLLYGHPGTAVLAGVGAVSVGFGAFQRPLFFRGSPMFTASAGIALSAFIGSLTGTHQELFLAIAMFWAFLYGLSDALGDAAAYVGLQCCVFLVVFSAIPQPPMQALQNGGIVLAGGLLQTLCVMLSWLIRPFRYGPVLEHSPASLRLLAQRALSPRSRNCHFAIRLAITAGVAVAVSWSLHFHNAYWVPMTALIIVKPQFKDTILRSGSRVLGTIAGAGVATALTVLLKPNMAVLIVLVLLCVGIFYVMLTVNYATYAIALTAYVAFILAMERMPEQQTVMRRIVATSLGGAIGFAVHLATFWLRHDTE